MANAETIETGRRIDALPPIEKPKTRISARLMDALVLIAEKGYSIKSAAEATGYHPTSLALALRRPHVIAAKQDIVAAFWSNAAGKARKALGELVETAKDEGVRLRAAVAILEKSGEMQAPSAGNTSVAVGQANITIIAPGGRQIVDLDADPGQVIDVARKVAATFNRGD